MFGVDIACVRSARRPKTEKALTGGDRTAAWSDSPLERNRGKHLLVPPVPVLALAGNFKLKLAKVSLCEDLQTLLVTSFSYA